MSALNAGVKTTEHGSHLDEEYVTFLKEKDAILVAARLVIQSGLENNEWPPLKHSRLVKIAGPRERAYALAVKM